VELGRRLFYDTRLSGNQTQACATCHRQEFAFADARSVPLGSTGEPHPRNSVGLTNAGYQLSFGWANPATRALEQQALIPMFGTHPVELGLDGREGELVQRLRDVPLYRDLFARSYPGQPDPVSLENLTRALAAFQRTLVSGNAPLDRWKRGDANAISAAAVRGEALFRSNRLHCIECHGGPFFSNALPGGPPGAPLPSFFNNGLYNIDGAGAYPPQNTGLFEQTHQPADMGRFKVPSLRNVALTFPYMHDGSIGSLGEVIDHYARGGRLIATGPNAGDGRLSPLKDQRISGFVISAQEKGDLLAFLASLTDSTVVANRSLSNPWER
jgi:cytochrome c peroxidase